MFFTFYNTVRYKPYISLIVYVLLTFYLITSNGCQTTSSERYTSDDLKTRAKLTDISHIILKDGTYINTEDKEVYYQNRYHDTDYVFVFVTQDTASMFENGKHVLKYVRKETILPLSKVQEVYVTKTELDAGKTLLLTVGIAVGLTLIFIVLALIAWSSSSNHSCPYVYSFNGSKYIYDAEPLGGVICEGLMRTDYSRLEHLSPADGNFRLLIRNENDEQQHLDEIKLIMVNHEAGTTVTPDMSGNFYKYTNIEPPLKVTDENGNDITKYFSAKDEYRWQTDMTSAVINDVKKHSLKFRFKKPENAKNALLFFNGGISLWGSAMVKSMLELRGNKIDNWYDELNKRGAGLKNLHEYILNEELYYLKVNLSEKGKNSVSAIIPGGGPKIDEDKVFIIPLENITGDSIEFELNPPAGYWKFEQIGLIYDYDLIVKKDINTLEASYGKDSKGNDITGDLNNIDKNYYNMPEVGNSCELYFNVPEEFRRTTSEIFLKSTGWYEINIDKTKPEQTDLISDIMNSPGKIIDYSMSLYNKKMKELAQVKNNLEKKSK